MLAIVGVNDDQSYIGIDDGATAASSRHVRTEKARYREETTRVKIAAAYTHALREKEKEK